MFFLPGQVTLELPDELNASRLWWLLASLPASDVDFVLETRGRVGCSSVDRLGRNRVD